MLSAREWAVKALRHLALPVPKNENKKLHVYVDDRRALPDFRIHCACPLVANYVWRAAHENGCAQIIVHASSTHAHRFDTINFLRQFTMRRLGFLPRPFTVRGRTPRYLATMGHRALGNTFDVTRPTFHVPIAVSGDAAGGKEL